jgi:hypothetical protein
MPGYSCLRKKSVCKNFRNPLGKESKLKGGKGENRKQSQPAKTGKKFYLEASFV